MWLCYGADPLRGSHTSKMCTRSSDDVVATTRRSGAFTETTVKAHETHGIQPPNIPTRTQGRQAAQLVERQVTSYRFGRW